MSKILIFLVALILTAQAFKSDATYEETYKVEIIRNGEYSHYPQKGDQVTVHYTGTLLDGKKFDSSKDRNQPFQFNVGVGRVIRCWDETIQRMTLGDHIKVTCPSATAYGSRGAGGLIPPNSDLIFEIEMISFGEHRAQDL